MEDLTSGSKRRRLVDSMNDQSQQQSLLTGLPDDVAQLCLARVHPSNLYSVCRSWRRLIYSPSFPPFLSLYAVMRSTSNSDPTQFHDSIDFFSFDPISSHWQTLPSPPPIHFVLRHPSFISRNLPIQSVTVSGRLVLIAATAHQFLPALPNPIVFDPLTQTWDFGPPLTAPRRWCATGVSGGAVYVASGIGSHYNSEIARSVEKWDLQNGKNRGRRGLNWEKLGILKDGKFSREAIDAVGWRKKLYMVNVKGIAAKEGVVYDVENDRWEEMPDGMICGWRGPAAAMDEETIFVVDEAKGILRRYEGESDSWADVYLDERLKQAEQMTAASGRVCVVCGDGGILVVDVLESPVTSWIVESPVGYQPVSLHILPRMSNI
ncbi:F-box/kelch-repeat protein SKIP25 [Impatiens glandulifera]|uniref:F-box/kelch-repeat protein SKIP25 n=1 Tax=Impatiens glandulifera TaxID=253017 RepID=UPI001FB0A041|nr:F-box/kelch-repeat protein SKIP25 [Impatiens glandulifera]